jgi:phytoene dehydrogenase-like protein
LFGADRRERLTPLEIVVRRGRVAGVRVRPRDETIGCHHLLWAGSAAGLSAALGPDAVAPHKRPQIGRVAGYRYGVAALVDPAALGPDTPSRVLAIGDPSRALTEDNAVAITIGQPTARDGTRVPLWIECGVPANLVDAGSSYLRALRGRVTHVLRRLLPGVAQHLVVLASPYDGLPPEHRGTPVPETTPPASLPRSPPPALVSVPSPRPLDVVGTAHATAVKNLYLVGRENLPGLGLEGELISGWGVARLVSSGPARKHLSPRRILISG